MKEFKVYYSYDISDGEELVKWKRDTFTISAESYNKVDTTAIKERINKIAESELADKLWFVKYANYYRIEEVVE